MHLSEHYRRIRLAGRFAFWFGVIQLILTPAYLTAPTVMSSTQLFFAGSLYIASSIILMIYGRHLRSQLTGDQTSLHKAQTAKSIINWTILISVLIAIPLTANFALLLISVALAMRWVTRSIRLISGHTNSNSKGN